MNQLLDSQNAFDYETKRTHNVKNPFLAPKNENTSYNKLLLINKNNVTSVTKKIVQ